MRKTTLKVRVTNQELRAFVAGAKRCGMTLSAWLRMLATRAAKKTPW